MEFSFVHSVLRICRIRYKRKAKKGGLKSGRSGKNECEETTTTLSLILLEVLGNTKLPCLLKALTKAC